MQKAEWIWRSREYEADEYAVFQDTISFSGEHTAMDISVAGDYALYVNGQLASFGQYPDYRHYKVYDHLDITPYLLEGENTIQITAWYSGLDCLTGYDFGAGLIYEAYTKEAVKAYSREGLPCGLYRAYQSHKKKLITTQLGYSYTFDARHQDEQSFQERAVRIDGMPEQLVKRPIEKLVLRSESKAELIDGKQQIYDLGAERCGFLSVGFTAPEGEVIRASFGEHLADGQVRSRIGDRDFSVELIGNGEYTEFLGTFRRLGCRYLQIEVSGETKIRHLGLCEVEYPFIQKEFHMSDPLRQQIYDTCVRTLRLCAHDHYEDCPWREQAMYIEDSRNAMLCGYYAFENAAEFVKASLELILQGQREDGLFELCFPCHWEFTIPSFCLVLPSAILEYARHSGDTELVRRAMPQIEKLLAYFMEDMEENGLYKTVSRDDVWHFYEWAGDLDGCYFSDCAEDKKRDDFDSLINAFLSLAVEKTVELYRILGDSQAALRYTKFRETLNKSIYKLFYREETGAFKTYSGRGTYSQLANALCILCGACPTEHLEEVAGKVAAGNAEWIPNTLSMNIFRYDALLTVNPEKYADFILNEIDKVYGHMLEEGATSFWETLNGESDFDGAGSLCHGWSAIPIYYYHTLNNSAG